MTINTGHFMSYNAITRKIDRFWKRKPPLPFFTGLSVIEFHVSKERSFFMRSISSVELGKAMRQFRLKAGFSQKEAAKVLHCSRSAYSYKEIGVSTFTFNDLYLLSELYSIAPEVFFRPETYN